MALFTGIGDFFRGAFGEDAEEKRRRKQREAQEAAARKQQSKQPRPQVQRPVQQTTFQQSVDPTKLASITKTPTLQQNQQPVVQAPRVQAPKPVTQPKVPAVIAPSAPTNYQDLGDVKDVGDYYGSDLKLLRQEVAKGDKADSQRIEGLKKSLDNRRKELTEYQKSKGKYQMSDLMGMPEDETKKFVTFTKGQRKIAKQREIDNTKPIEISAGGGNKAKFTVGEYARYLKSQPEQQQVQILKGLTQQAEKDEGSRKILEGLNRNGELQGDLQDVWQGFNQKAGGGLLRAGQRFGQTGLEVLDKILPGQDQASQMKWGEAADKLDEDYKNTKGAYTQSGKSGESFGTIAKSGVDVASLFAGSGAATAGAEAAGWTTKIAPLLKNSNPIIRLFGRALAEVPGSLAGTAISSAQTRGKGEEQNLGKDAAIGLAADVALPYGGKFLRRLLRGGANQVDDAAELAAKELEEGIAKRSEGVQEAVARDTDKEIEELQAWNQENVNRQLRGEEPLPRPTKPVPVPDPIDTPPLQFQKELDIIAQREYENLDRYVNSRPDLTQPQIEAAAQATRERVVKLAEDLKATRYGTDAVVADQAAQADEVVQAQQATNAEVAAEQAARTEPVANTQGDTPSGTGEIQANDGTRQSTEDILYSDAPGFQEKGRLSIPQLFSPDRAIRENITRPGERLVDSAVSALQTSNNRAARGVGRLFNGFTREAGVSPELMTARMQLRGGIESGKVNMQTIGDLGEKMNSDQLADVWATIDTEYGARLGKEIDPTKLNPEQQALRQKLVDIRDNTTVENMKRGLITKEQAANGDYINRDYSVLYEPEGEVGQFERGFRTELLNQYKGRKLVSDEMVESAITDPAYLVGKKQAQSEAAWAMQDYGNFLVKNGNVSPTAQPGFVQLPDTPLFGEARAKFVPKNLAEDFTGFQYDIAMVSAFNDMISAYDRLGIRQAKKQLLTIFNPAVRLGNQVTNRGIFSQLNGINPVQFNIAMQAAKKEMAQGGQLYREAVQQGLTGVDITQAEFFAKRVGGAADNDKGIIKSALDWTRSSYSGADDQGRIAAYMVKRNQGYSPEEAARQVQRGFQDYKSVGFFYDMAAKTPIIGNAFVRFAADSVRIAKNAALDHPLRTMGTIAAWSAFVNGMSVISGESDLGEGNAASKAFNLVTGKNKSDKQKNRESRFGAPKLPFTDISTTVQTPFGEINVARFMPWYQLQDIDGAGLERVLPFSQSPIELKDGKFAINPQAMNDPLLGQIVQLGVDKDFRDKSIRDPKANGDKYAMAPLAGDEQVKNVLRFLFNNNAPLGREIDQTAAAATGNKDIYGKDRNIWQALARNMGFKIEQQGDEQAKDRASLQNYMAEKEQIDKELETMTPAAQEAWRRLTGYYKLRDQVPNEFAPGETRDKKAEVYGFGEDKWKDYAAHPELYKMMVEKKQREAATDGKPIAPEFDGRLSEAFRTQLIQNKMVAPGDDAELDQRMYSTPEWDYYNDLKDKYKEDAAKYYPKSDKEDFDDESVAYEDEKFPTKPDVLKAYSAEYKRYLDGKRDKPVWNDQLTAQKEQYNKMTLDWTNKARTARGLPAITWDVWNNPTFGFDETPSGMGGFGFGGGGGGGARDVNTTTRLTNYGDSVKRLEPLEAQAAPNVVQVFQKLMASNGGGRAKPKLGASSSGRG